ncbi:MAG: RAMP superfamily CRISPR-associated protein, partial [Nocardioides sp.]
MVEPIHLGSGHPVGPQKPLPILKGSDETPFVPGSSWKGLFRHRIQVILRAVGASSSQVQAVTAWVFGGRDRRSRVRFEDSPMTGGVAVAPHHIAIDRFTGGARASALYRLAAAPRGATLELAWSWLEDPDPAARA